MSIISNSFNERSYTDFLRDAKVFSGSLKCPGSKISWGIGKIPSYDSPQLFQGVVRKIKDWMPFFVANGLQSSQYAIDWAEALSNKNFSLLDKDKELFSLAQQAFLRQAVLYKGEAEKSHKKDDEEAANNYQLAAVLLENIKNSSIKIWRMKLLNVGI